MSKVTEPKQKQIIQAAFMFARITRDANEMAEALRVSLRTVQRLMDFPEFHAELDDLGYDGERNFKVKEGKRGKGRTAEYEHAKRLWEEMTDVPEDRRLAIIRKQVKTPYHTLRVWTLEWRNKDLSIEE